METYLIVESFCSADEKFTVRLLDITPSALKMVKMLSV